MWSEFEAKVAVGLFGSVAILLLEEHEITLNGNRVSNGCKFAVKSDLKRRNTFEWINNIKPKGSTVDVGIYYIKGRVKFKGETTDYYKVKFIQIR